MQITDQDKARFGGRSQSVDYAGLDRLHHLGTYVRKLPVSLSRMMENAYDWEHLPFVHPQAFADIALAEQGEWGWRCKAELPKGAGAQLIELLVDKDAHYWATTVLEGLGAGVQIHTKAKALDGPQNIEVEVRFYHPQKPENQAQADMLKAMLTQQYTELYDQDEALMMERQAALDKKRGAANSHGHQGSVRSIDLGPQERLDPAKIHEIELGGEGYCVRFLDGAWHAHFAVCPHMLSPLKDAKCDTEGRIICPWHGYRFALADGSEAQSRCGHLALARCAVNEAGHLIVSLPD
jgi:nitrite reductase/ring-hydroxylating ferredoxin subunit